MAMHWLGPVSRWLLRNDENYKYLNQLLDDPLQWEKLNHDEMRHKKTGLVLVCNPYFKFDHLAIAKQKYISLNYLMKSALLSKAFRVFSDTEKIAAEIKLTNLINQLKQNGDQDQC